MPLLFGLEEVERSSFGDEEHSLEFKLTLHREVLDGKVVFPIITDGFVERGVLLSGDFRRVSDFSDGNIVRISMLFDTALQILFNM